MSDEILDDGLLEEAKTTTAPKAAVKITDDKATYAFLNTDAETLASRVQEFLIKQGYNLEQGAATGGTYGKGSKIGRVLLGAFIKRFTWKVTVVQDDDRTILQFKKEEKGYWGGVIGVSQVKSEYSKITSLLKQFHQKHHEA